VTRKINRDDQREAFLSLTPAGRAIYNDLVPTALDFERELLDALEPSERVMFNRVLDKLIKRSTLLDNDAGKS
jgi:DNA-binding MarR family transcriptional regulator